MFGLVKTSKHNFAFVFVHKCERVSFKNNQGVSRATMFGSGV